MEIKKLLPIGSVVLMKKGIKKLMIVGIKPINKETNEEFDYIGVMYPEGYIGNEGSLLFRHKDICDVIYRGYENPEREEFIQLLDEAYKKN